MDYLDSTLTYNENKVIEGIVEIDNQIQEEYSKEKADQPKLTQLRFEQMLRGLYLFQNPNFH